MRKVYLLCGILLGGRADWTRITTINGLRMCMFMCMFMCMCLGRHVVIIHRSVSLDALEQDAISRFCNYCNLTGAIAMVALLCAPQG